MDNSTPVFWIWILIVVLFAAAITIALYFVKKDLESGHKAQSLSLTQAPAQLNDQVGS